MITVEILSNDGYSIKKNETLIVTCKTPRVTFNELLKELNIIDDGEIVNIIGGISYVERDTEKYTEKFTIHDELEDSHFHQTVTNIRSSFDGIIDSIENTFEDVLDKVNSKISSKSTIDELTDNDYKESKTKISNVPVGSVEKPELGDLIYVDGMKGILRNILGGVATVASVYENDLNIVVEIEEVPGSFFSWTKLKEEQPNLATKFGYKPVQVL